MDYSHCLTKMPWHISLSPTQLHTHTHTHNTQHLVTCQSQPALGCVYKLVEINDQPRIKLSQEVEKLVIPCKKNVYRLLGADGKPLVDILQMAGEQPPVVGVRILCRHPFMENKRAYVTPSAIVPLLNLVWDGPNGGQKVPIKPLKEVGLTFACLCTCLCALLSSLYYTALLCLAPKPSISYSIPHTTKQFTSMHIQLSSTGQRSLQAADRCHAPWSHTACEPHTLQDLCLPAAVWVHSQVVDGRSAHSRPLITPHPDSNPHPHPLVKHADMQRDISRTFFLLHCDPKRACGVVCCITISSVIIIEDSFRP